MNEQVVNQPFFDKELRAVVNVYPSVLSNDDFVNRATTTLNLIKSHSSKKLLSDTSTLGVVGNDKQKFIRTVWFPKAVEYGLKAIAFVIPKDVFGSFGLKQANNKADEELIEKLTIGYFNNRDEATKWLASLGEL